MVHSFTQKCEGVSLKSPIDLGPPWIYKNFNITSTFTQIVNLEIFKESDQTFQTEENFGNIIYNNQTFQAF